MAKYFKGKSIGYHTSITLSKSEGILVWIISLLCLAVFISTIFIFDSVWTIVLIDFIAFIIMFIIFFLILFSPKHEEERIENTRITK